MFRRVIRALFFDAAGTLIEPAEPVAEVYARAAAAAGYSVEAAAVKQAFGAAFYGIADPDWNAHPHGDAAEREWWKAVVCRTFGQILGEPLPELSAEKIFHQLFAHYADPGAWSVFPEVPEVLAAAREAGFRSVVVSNFDRRLHGILEGHGLAFEAVVTSADARSRKPEPAIFRHALDLLGLSPQEAFHTGDSRTADLEGAKAVGIEAFLVDRPHTGLRDFLQAALEKRGK
jgi:putative hydrolase of the HAD superfamily